MSRSVNAPNGFTLIELLLVIGVIAILASITILAVNPKRQLDQSKDVVREQHLKVLLDALYQYKIKEDEFPQVAKTLPTVDTTHRPICSLTGVVRTDLFFCTFVPPLSPARVPLGQLLPDYVGELPHDPDNTATYETGYQVWVDAAGRLTVAAPLGRGGEGIELSR